MSPIRDDLDPAALVRVADSREPCVFCGVGTTGRSTGEGGEPTHIRCLRDRMWMALALERGAITTEPAYWKDEES